MKWRPIFATPLRSADWVLPIMIIVALLTHGLAFYLVQTSSVRNKSKVPIRSRLTTLDPNRKADVAFLNWIENHDPATIAGNDASPQPPQSLLSAPYHPSYEQVLPEPLPVSEEEKTGLRQSLFPPGPVPESAFRDKKRETPAFPQLATQFVTSPALTIETRARFLPPVVSNKLPLPTHLLVVASQVSDERFFFLTDSSGIEELDLYAKAWLAQSKIAFAKGSPSGWVTVYWGSEIWKSATP